MMSDKSKVVLLLSSAPWEKMRVSKHHYAIELARRGHQVYYVSPPAGNDGPLFRAHCAPGYANITIVRPRLLVPAALRFKAPRVYRRLIRQQQRLLLRFIGRKVDLVWCFDYIRSYTLGAFHPAKILFHPVDFMHSAIERRTGEGADLTLSVVPEILEQCPNTGRKAFLPHGISDAFAQLAARAGRGVPPKGSRIAVGYAGAINRPDIDFACIQRIVEENPEVDFRFWAENLKGSRPPEFARLSELDNVTFEGAVTPDVLARCYDDIDVFLCCYDIDKDQSKGTNYHKLMEYFAAGSVIVCNNVTTYADRPELIQMPTERHNEKLPQLFSEVVNNLEQYNSPKQMQVRKDYASQNRYIDHVETIWDMLGYAGAEGS